MCLALVGSGFPARRFCVLRRDAVIESAGDSGSELSNIALPYLLQALYQHIDSGWDQCPPPTLHFLNSDVVFLLNDC